MSSLPFQKTINSILNGEQKENLPSLSKSFGKSNSYGTSSNSSRSTSRSDKGVLNLSSGHNNNEINDDDDPDRERNRRDVHINEDNVEINAAMNNEMGKVVKRTSGLVQVPLSNETKRKSTTINLRVQQSSDEDDEEEENEATLKSAPPPPPNVAQAINVNNSKPAAKRSLSAQIEKEVVIPSTIRDTIRDNVRIGLVKRNSIK